MYVHEDQWEGLLNKLKPHLHYIYTVAEKVLLYLPYVIRHERDQVVARLIKPDEIEIGHTWPEDFIGKNESKIMIATTIGRVKKGEGPHAKIFSDIESFEKNKSDLFIINNYKKSYGEIKLRTPTNVSAVDFEWEGLDGSYPVALLAKTDSGIETRLCTLVVTLVYPQPQTNDDWETKNKQLKKYLQSFAKQRINISPAPQKIEHLDAEDWNSFRRFSQGAVSAMRGFHHLPHGGDAFDFSWEDAQSKLTSSVKGLLISSNYPLNDACGKECMNRTCKNPILGYPHDRPSVRELLQWTYKGRSLTRALTAGTLPITAVGEIHHDYCWVNPFSIRAFVEAVAGPGVHEDERDSAVPNSGCFNGAFIHEVEEIGKETITSRKGLWLFINIPGLLTSKITKENTEQLGDSNHHFFNAIKKARKAGFKQFYRIDWSINEYGLLDKALWTIKENEIPWINKIDNPDQEISPEIMRVLPGSGIAAFIPARETTDFRYCWEIKVDSDETTPC